jgi:hypothetical protein
MVEDSLVPYVQPAGPSSSSPSWPDHAFSLHSCKAPDDYSRCQSLPATKSVTLFLAMQMILMAFL